MPKLPHAKKSLCRKVFKPKCPQRQNVHVQECPRSRKVPIAKCFCDDLSMPKFYANFRIQIQFWKKQNLCVFTWCFSLLVQSMANVKAIQQFFGNSVFISSLKFPNTISVIQHHPMQWSFQIRFFPFGCFHFFTGFSLPQRQELELATIPQYFP